MPAANNFDVLGAGVGLLLLGFIVSLGDATGLMDVLTVGEGFDPIFDGGGGGAGLFFLLFGAYELHLLPVDNAGEGGERKVTFEYVCDRRLPEDIITLLVVLDGSSSSSKSLPNGFKLCLIDGVLGGLGGPLRGVEEEFVLNSFTASSSSLSSKSLPNGFVDTLFCVSGDFSGGVDNALDSLNNIIGFSSSWNSSSPNGFMSLG